MVVIQKIYVFDEAFFSLSNQFYDNWESVFFLLSWLPLLGKQDLSSQLCSLSIQITVSLKYWSQTGKDEKNALLQSFIFYPEETRSKRSKNLFF